LYKPKDTYFYKAKREGYPARSVYKLEEIDKKYRIIKRGSKILELGASPGSWLKYCLNKIGKDGHIVAIDLERPSLALTAQVDFIQEDIFKVEAASLQCNTNGLGLHAEGQQSSRQSNSFDLVLSDLAPRTSGIKEVDQARSMELAKRAIDIGGDVLKKGGDILVKLFESGDVPNLRKELSSLFSKVDLERPKAVRHGSSEIYLLGFGFRSTM